MWPLMKPFLFAMDPERAHGLALASLRLAGGFAPLHWLLRLAYGAPSRPVTVWGRTFSHPVGLAAGWDKDALALRGLSALGFSHVEVGTVTPKPQPGREKPRVFRLREDHALINRMGFPSRGEDFVARRLALPRRPGLLVGVNLGKNKDTPNDAALADYARLVTRFSPLADYLVVNVSSPNTQGLRALQARDELEALLGGLASLRAGLVTRAPLLVKLAPDLDDEALEVAVGVAIDQGLDGVIVNNTTLSREGLRSRHRDEAGGASGAILTGRAQAVLERTVAVVGGRVPVVSVGGIMTPEDARRRLDSGAALIQVYTGLVYAGPALTRRIVKALAEATAQ